MRHWQSAATVAVLLASVAGCSDTKAGPSPISSSAAAQCVDPTVGPLPQWARAGFSPPDQPATYFLGAGARIVGVAFGWPLRATQPPGRQNKILWIAPTTGPGPLRITATRLGSDVTVTREIDGGPGPSIVDMPRDGCWRFDLTWSGGNDRMYVRYGGAES